VWTWRVASLYSVQYSEVWGYCVLLVCTVYSRVKCEDMACCSSVQCTVQWSVRIWRVARLYSVQCIEVWGHGVLLVCTVYCTAKCEHMMCCLSLQWNSSISETVWNRTHMYTYIYTTFCLEWPLLWPPTISTFHPGTSCIYNYQWSMGLGN
jgi:hypothetical protein